MSASVYNPHGILDALGSAREVELPAWGHRIGRSVYPLFVVDGDIAYPMGTAFLISPHGYIVTAAHTIFEGISREPRLAHLQNSLESGGAFDLKKIGFAVLIHYPTPDGGFRAHMRGLENIGGAPPTDLVIGSIADFHDPDPEAALVMSPGLPLAGNELIGIGYHGMPREGVAVAALMTDPDTLLRDYNHRVRLVRGRIEAVFVSRVSHGFCNAPALLMDFESYGGQSGGPVVGATGVCGLISATATNFVGHPATFCSMLYPLLTTSVTKVLRLAPNFTINVGMPMGQLIATGLIKTDGSERQFVVRQSPDGLFSLSPLVKTGSPAQVFDDLDGFLTGRPAQTKPFDTGNSHDPKLGKSE